MPNCLRRGSGVDRDLTLGGGRGRIYLKLHCHHHNDSCMKMGSDESHFNVSLIVRDKVTTPYPPGKNNNRKMSSAAVCRHFLLLVSHKYHKHIATDIKSLLDVLSSINGGSCHSYKHIKGSKERYLLGQKRNLQILG